MLNSWPIIQLAIENHFALVKGVGFVVAFIGVTIIQTQMRNHGNLHLEIRNWCLNLPLALLNSVLMGFACTACACQVSLYLEAREFGLFNVVHLPLYLEIPITVLLLDFTAYVWHKANHRVPHLWRFHAVHHSDTNFDTSTAVRFHFGELFISLGVRICMVAIFGVSVSALLFFELIYQLFNIFEHGNITLSPKFEKGLGRYFLTPALHRRHHSIVRRDLDSNFGTIFSFWDKFFSTFSDSTSLDQITVGLPDEFERKMDLLALVRMPFHRSTTR